MGEVSEMILDGTLCQICGGVFADLIPDKGRTLLDSPGHPRTCKSCEKGE